MKNLMKKSVVSAVLVLVMFSVASAATGFVSGGSSTRVVAPGDVITIDLVTDADGTSLTMQNIIETPGVGGTASNLVLSPAWDWNIFDWAGNLVNAGGVLIQNVSGKITLESTMGGLYATGTVYSFDYTVPSSIPAIWTIGPGAGTNGMGLPDLSSVTPGALTLTPEPMTIILLGLGGLFLRRRK